MNPKIGDVKAFSEIYLDLDEIFSKLEELREGTTCSNVDNIIAAFRTAHTEFDEYFKWVDRTKAKSEEENEE